MSDMSVNYPFLQLLISHQLVSHQSCYFKGFNLVTVLNFHFQLHEAKLLFALKFIVHFV